MNFNNILNPALYIMNHLSFKVKITASASILFLLLILPSQTIFMNYYKENNTYTQQLMGLEYIKIIHKIIKSIQIHRSQCNIYLNGKIEIKEEIMEQEEILFLKIDSLFNYDSKNLKILNSNQNIATAISLFEFVKINKLTKDGSNSDIFKEHNNIVNLFQKVILDISKQTFFNVSEDLKINYLADMLQDKLLNIYENTGQLHGLSSTVLTQKSMIYEQKKVLLALSTELVSLKSNLTDNHVLSNLSNYLALHKQTLDVADKLEKILAVIDNEIILKEDFKYNNKLFTDKVSNAMYSQEELYKRFILTYSDIIKELQKNSKNELWNLLFGFLAIVLTALYIFIAFYQSIISNLKKLQEASEMISEGKTDIHLDVQKKDEIGKALLAFNTMSDKLSKNISFLDGYKLAIDNSSIVSKTDLKGIITYANKMFCDVSGYSQSELIGSSHNIVRHPDVPKEAFEDLWSTIQAKKIWKGVVKNRKKDGSYYIVNATIIPILDNKGEIREYVAVRHDITELEDNKEEIKKQRVDLLTGLPNRNQLSEDLKTAIKPILLYLNIDDFSGFNDFYGKAIADNTLIRLSKILAHMNNQNRFRLYKLEADQFILLFEEGYLSRDNLQYYFEELISELEAKITDPNLENRERISVSVSGGAATYYVNDDYQKLILYSNIARKRARKEHKKFLLFHHSMRKSEDYAHNIEWIKRIKEAIVDNRIVCYYQPIFDNKTDKLVKYESLVRLIDKDGQAISPFFFLEIARKAKLYDQITKIVIDKTFDTFKELKTEQFSVNLTIDDILSEKTTNYIYQKLENYPNPNRVIFEITESQKVEDYEYINRFIKYVKEYNVQIAIDDFGSGYANFEHILNIDADIIKIDGSLIKNIETNKNSKIITEAIISFSKKLGRKTIAEFIHNEEIHKIVKELGADYSQGFYLGTPSPNIKIQKN